MSISLATASRTDDNSLESDFVCVICQDLFKVTATRIDGDSLRSDCRCDLSGSLLKRLSPLSMTICVWTGWRHLLVTITFKVTVALVDDLLTCGLTGVICHVSHDHF